MVVQHDNLLHTFLLCGNWLAYTCACRELEKIWRSGEQVAPLRAPIMLSWLKPPGLFCHPDFFPCLFCLFFPMAWIFILIWYYKMNLKKKRFNFAFIVLLISPVIWCFICRSVHGVRKTTGSHLLALELLNIDSNFSVLEITFLAC